MSSAIGDALRQIRRARGKSLAVVAGLAGISTSYLSRLETGDRALDSRALVVRLAEALEVAPSEITGSWLPMPGEAAGDRALNDVRLALMGVSVGEPRGEIRPADQLRDRVTTLLADQNDARATSVGAALPALIRDLHTSLDARRDERTVLRLLTLAHMQGTQAWLAMIGAPLDLGWQAATLAREAAEQLDELVPLAISAYGTSLGLLGASAFDLASDALADVELPGVTVEELQLTGSLALASSLVAAARREHAERAAALEFAADLAEQTGETNLMGFGFGPSNVGVWRMQGALEAGEHAEAARIAETVNADALTVRARQAVYWRDRGRALAALPRKRDQAVVMLRRAEEISPEHVLRHPFTVSLLSEMVAKAKRDTVGRELRGIACRAGVHV